MDILIPAAGQSSRMGGRDKLAELIDGQALLTRTVRRACATGQAVRVTLRPQDARRGLVEGLGVDLLEVPDCAEGLAASLRRGAVGSGSLMILPADMPDVTTQDLNALIAAHAADPRSILRASDADGTPGHPVIFPADLRAAFADLSGDTGARAILGRHADRLALFALPGAHATTDLDTPEAWARWRATRSSG